MPPARVTANGKGRRTSTSSSIRGGQAGENGMSRTSNGGTVTSDNSGSDFDSTSSSSDEEISDLEDIEEYRKKKDLEMQERQTKNYERKMQEKASQQLKQLANGSESTNRTISGTTDTDDSDEDTESDAEEHRRKISLLEHNRQVEGKKRAQERRKREKEERGNAQTLRDAPESQDSDDSEDKMDVPSSPPKVLSQTHEVLRKARPPPDMLAFLTKKIVRPVKKPLAQPATSDKENKSGEQSPPTGELAAARRNTNEEGETVELSSKRRSSATSKQRQNVQAGPVENHDGVELEIEREEVLPDVAEDNQRDVDINLSVATPVPTSDCVNVATKTNLNKDGAELEMENVTSDDDINDNFLTSTPFHKPTKSQGVLTISPVIAKTTKMKNVIFTQKSKQTRLPVRVKTTLQQEALKNMRDAQVAKVVNVPSDTQATFSVPIFGTTTPGTDGKDPPVPSTSTFTIAGPQQPDKEVVEEPAPPKPDTLPQQNPPQPESDSEYEYELPPPSSRTRRGSVTAATSLPKKLSDKKRPPTSNKNLKRKGKEAPVGANKKSKKPQPRREATPPPPSPVHFSDSEPDTESPIRKSNSRKRESQSSHSQRQQNEQLPSTLSQAMAVASSSTAHRQSSPPTGELELAVAARRITNEEGETVELSSKRRSSATSDREDELPPSSRTRRGRVTAATSPPKKPSDKKSPPTSNKNLKRKGKEAPVGLPNNNKKSKKPQPRREATPPPPSPVHFSDSEPETESPIRKSSSRKRESQSSHSQRQQNEPLPSNKKSKKSQPRREATPPPPSPVHLSDSEPETESRSSHSQRQQNEQLPSTLSQAMAVASSSTAHRQSSQVSLLSQQSTVSNRPRHGRRSIFEKARDLGAASNTTKKMNQRPKEKVPDRYVGDDVFGNYHMMKEADVRALLNANRPNHGMDEEQVAQLSLKINHWLEDFFVDQCNQTPHPYGFVSFSGIKEALIEQCLLDEDASNADLMREMKANIPEEDFRRGEGIIYPSTSSGQGPDVDDTETWVYK